MTREYRLITIAEDYGETVLCLTNMDNDDLHTMLVQFDKEMEDGNGKPFSEIVENLVDLHDKGERFVDTQQFMIDEFIKELGDTTDSDFEDIRHVDTQCITYYSCYTVNVVSSKVRLGL